MKRKKFKIILAVTLATVLGANCLVGCGAKQEAAEETESVLEEEQQEKDDTLSALSTSASDSTEAPTPKPTAKPTEKPAPTPEPTVEPTPEPAVEEATPTPEAAPDPTEAPKEEKVEPEQPKEEVKEAPKEEKPEEPAKPEDKMAAAGIFTRMELGKEYEYTTECMDSTDKTTGKVKISSYSRTDNGDGYETIKATLSEEYSDKNANLYGICDYYGLLDRYSYEEGTFGVTGDIYFDVKTSFSLNHEGESYGKCTAKVECTRSEWVGTTAYVDLLFTVKVPVGYGGIAIYTTCYPGESVEHSFGKNLSKSKYPVLTFYCE